MINGSQLRALERALDGPCRGESVEERVLSGCDLSGRTPLDAPEGRESTRGARRGVAALAPIALTGLRSALHLRRSWLTEYYSPMQASLS